MRLWAHGRRQDSMYIVAVPSRTPMVVGLYSAAIPDTAVPKDIVKVTFVAKETTCQLRGRLTRSASQEHTRRGFGD